MFHTLPNIHVVKPSFGWIQLTPEMEKKPVVQILLHRSKEPQNFPLEASDSGYHLPVNDVKTAFGLSTLQYLEDGVWINFTVDDKGLSRSKVTPASKIEVRGEPAMPGTIPCLPTCSLPCRVCPNFPYSSPSGQRFQCP